VFFILQWHFVNVWQPQITRNRACIGVLYLAVTFCQRLTAALFLLIWGCQTLTKCHCKIKKNANSVPFNLGLSNVDKMSLEDKEHQYKLCSFFCQRLTASNQKEQSLYWCSLSCSDIFVNVWQPQIKIKNTNTSSVPFDLRLSIVDKMSLQDKEHQSKLCSFWFGPVNSPKSKGTELVLVFFILQWHFVNVWQPQIKRNRACIGVLYLAVTSCQRLTAPNQKEENTNCSF
jgi:hypothetical protein